MATDIKNDATLSTSLVSVWLSDSSSLTEDLHGSNDLTNSGTATGSGGPQGTTGDFERGDPDKLYIENADQTGLNFGTAMSLSLWIEFESDPGGTMYLVNRFKGTGGDKAYSFLYDASGNNLAMDTWQNCSTSNTRMTQSWTPSLATWYHVVFTFDAGTTEFWVDGSSLGTSSNSIAGLCTGNADFQIGTLTTSGNAHDGQMNQVAVWGKKLSSGEIADLYNSGSGIPYEDAGGGGGGTAFSQAVVMV